jgi:hypothetical protein
MPVTLYVRAQMNLYLMLPHLLNCFSGILHTASAGNAGVKSVAISAFVTSHSRVYRERIGHFKVKNACVQSRCHLLQAVCEVSHDPGTALSGSPSPSANRNRQRVTRTPVMNIG